jgi:hypothetical protein
MQIVTFSLTPEDLAEELDKAKDMVVERLVKKGLLDKEQGDLFRKTNAFFLKKPGTISSLWRKFFDRGEDKDWNKHYNILLAEFPLLAVEEVPEQTANSAHPVEGTPVKEEAPAEEVEKE